VSAFALRGERQGQPAAAPSTLYKWHNIVKAEIGSALGSRRPEEITRREVRTFMETIAEQRPYWANLPLAKVVDCSNRG
jgi:hypothetical protein